MILTKTSDIEVDFTTTPVYEWNYQSEKRIKVNQGGSSSGKTYAILQVIMMRLIQKRRIATVAGQDIPNLKKGALRDFNERILDSTPFFRTYIKRYNKSDRTFFLTNGSILEFNSYSDRQDAKSGKRDILFVNEANGISYEVYKELAKRTGEEIFIDYNPNAAFWVHDNLVGREDTTVFYSNFTHNPYADPEMINEIRMYQGLDDEAWKVYGLGKTGSVQEVIFGTCELIPKFPEIIRKPVYGLDFGFNHPSALVRLGVQNRRLYGEELLYKRGLTNQQIAEEMKTLGLTGRDEIWADAAEPKSIKEINEYGFNVRAAKKGPDSILFGIKLLKKLGISITVDSVNWKRERNRYKWKVDKDGNQMEIPVDLFNHCWDAARYAAIMKYGHLASRGPRFAGQRQ